MYYVRLCVSVLCEAVCECTVRLCASALCEAV